MIHITETAEATANRFMAICSCGTAGRWWGRGKTANEAVDEMLAQSKKTLETARGNLEELEVEVQRWKQQEKAKSL